MVKYLQIDSVDDNLKTPSFSFTEVVIDFTPYQPSTGAKYYLDFRDASNTTHYFYSNNTNDTYNGFTSFFVNEVSKGNNVSSVPRSSRSTVRLVSSAAITRVGTIGARYLNDLRMQMDIYNIKFYNGATLVAHYDMSTGTVQDQSGNGYNATLTGGTWLDDGTGGSTGTTYTGEGTLQGSSTLSSTEQAILKALGTAQGYSSLSSVERTIAKAVGTVQGYSILSSGETLITFTGNTYAASGTIQGYSSVTSSEKAIFEELGTAYGYSANQVHEIVTLLASGIAEGYSNVILIEKKEIIAQVTLTGWQRLEARLVGRQNKDVQLQGKQVANAQLKGVMK